MGGDGIHIPFHNHYALLASRFLGQVKTIKDVALVENRCPRRVQVFGLGVVQSPGAKPTQATLAVPDGEHQPAAEQVMVPTVLGRAHDPGLVQLLERKPLFDQMVLQRFAIGGAESNLKLFYGWGGYPSLIQIGPGFSASRGCQQFLKIGPGRLVDVVVALALVPLLRVGQFYARLLGKVFQGIAELHVFGLHYKGKDVAPSGAGAEASPRLTLGKNKERRRFLLVERARSLMATAGALQRSVAGHDF